MHKDLTWRRKFPGLTRLSTTVSDVLDQRAVFRTHRTGAIVFEAGNTAEDLLLLVSGTLRVQQLSQAGQDIVLCRVHGDESCALTSACLLAFEGKSATGIAETDIEAILIPRDTFDTLMSVSTEFRGFVFEAYSKRITDLFNSIDDIAPKRMNMPAAHMLPDVRDGQTTLRQTHHGLS